MKLFRLNSLLLGLAAGAALLPLAAHAERWSDQYERHDRYYREDDRYDRHARVVIVERERCVVAPRVQIPYAIKGDHRGFVISPYTGLELDVRGVKCGALCYDFTAQGRPYICP